LPILFHAADITFNLKRKNIFRKWIISEILNYSLKPGNINIIFCSDEYLLGLNRKYLNHDYYTDIVTFHFEEKESTLTGELYISIERIRENAVKFKIKTEEEKRRVIIHGLLHLLGFNDENREEKEMMTALEDKYLLDFEQMLTKSST